MNDPQPIDRRRLLQTALGAVATVGLDRPAMTAPTQGSWGLMGQLRFVRTDVLDIGYHAFGPANGSPVVLLHGFPYDVHSYVTVAPSLAAAGFHVLVPHLRGHGATRFRSADAPRSGQQAALAVDVRQFLDALGIRRAILAGYDWGGRAACVTAALWPERCAGLVSVNGYLIQDIAASAKPLAASVERGFWYQFYFLTERGRAGLAAHRAEIARLMWRDNSPAWAFDDATFARSAGAFDNSDYVPVVIHSYRHRLGTALGSPEYADLEGRLAAQPPITVPAITLDGIADGVVPATDGTGAARHFTGWHRHRQIAGAGHNLPQEAPAAFAEAVADVGRLTRKQN